MCSRTHEASSQNLTQVAFQARHRLLLNQSLHPSSLSPPSSAAHPTPTPAVDTQRKPSRLPTSPDSHTPSANRQATSIQACPESLQHAGTAHQSDPGGPCAGSSTLETIQQAPPPQQQQQQPASSAHVSVSRRPAQVARARSRASRTTLGRQRVQVEAQVRMAALATLEHTAARKAGEGAVDARATCVMEGCSSACTHPFDPSARVTRALGSNGCVVLGRIGVSNGYVEWVCCVGAGVEWVCCVVVLGYAGAMAVSRCGSSPQESRDTLRCHVYSGF